MPANSSDNPMPPSPAPLSPSAAPAPSRFLAGAIANPAANASLTQAMAGIGSTLTFTPTQTGRVLISISGIIANNTASDGYTASIRYGTGAAPVNGAALTGLPGGPSIGALGNAGSAALGSPFTLVGIATGLSPGVPVWIDIAFAPLVGGTATLSSLTAALIEF